MVKVKFAIKGHHAHCTVNGKTKIGKLRTLLADILDVVPETITIKFNGNVLKGTSTINSVGIKEDTELEYEVAP